MMAPPDNLSLYENFDKHSNNYSTSSLLLSPFPSFTNCINQMSVFSEHNYFFKNIGDNMKQDNVSLSPEECYDFHTSASTSSDKSEVMTPCEVSGDSPSPTLSPSNSDDVFDNVFNDVTLVSRLEAPISCDTDFLKGLDELEFDFDDCEPSRGVSLENFIDATLEDTMDLSVNDCNFTSRNSQEIAEEEEDVYKKEFFLKHIRLQRVPSKSTVSSQSRKRKHEESESKNPDSLYPPNSSLRVPVPEFGNNSYSIPSHSSLKTSTHHTHTNSSPSPLHSSDTFFIPLSVPSKLCSCSSSDWKRTILYSTAKSCSVTSVQTSPSTASVSGIPSHGGSGGLSPRCHSDSSSSSSYILDNDDDASRLSPSLLLSDRAKDCFEFDLLDKNEMDEDTKDLLQWLDSQDIQTTMAGIASSYNHTSSAVHSRSLATETDSNASNPASNGVITVADDLEDILSPQTQQSSSLELDTFQDLEAYVLDQSSPTKEVQQKISNNNNNDLNVCSKSQIRLSILADISTDFLNSEYKEKKEAIKRDILKSCQSNFVSFPSNHHNFLSKRTNFISEDWCNSAFSSPSSLSSPSSSPPHSSSDYSQKSSPYLKECVHHEQSKNLELLDLFADENAVWCW